MKLVSGGQLQMDLTLGPFLVSNISKLTGSQIDCECEVYI